MQAEGVQYVVQFDATPVLSNLKVLFGEESEDTVATQDGREKLAFAILFSITKDADVAHRLRTVFCDEKLNAACSQKSWMFIVDDLQIWIDSIRAN